MLVSGKPTTASESENLKSQDSAKSSPPPNAKPCILAIVGNESASILSNKDLYISRVIRVC